MDTLTLSRRARLAAMCRYALWVLIVLCVVLLWRVERVVLLLIHLTATLLWMAVVVMAAGVDE